VYTSDLRRALDTARAIARPHGLVPVVDLDLREIDQGEWTGLGGDEIRTRWPDLWKARNSTARPGGESPAQVRERAAHALRRIVERSPDGTVLIVTHGVTIRYLTAEVLGYDDARAARLRGLGNGGAVRFEATLYEDRLVLEGFERLDGATPDIEDPND
jgi:alpha-ribazole phosphatase/probable phosphoglycerate mutase